VEDAPQEALAVLEGLFAEILAVELDEVEGVEDHGAVMVAGAQALQQGKTGGVAGDRLAIDQEGLAAQPVCGRGDQWIALVPALAAASEDARAGGVAPHHQAIAVVCLQDPCRHHLAELDAIRLRRTVGDRREVGRNGSFHVTRCL